MSEETSVPVSDINITQEQLNEAFADLFASDTYQEANETGKRELIHAELESKFSEADWWEQFVDLIGTVIDAIEAIVSSGEGLVHQIVNNIVSDIIGRPLIWKAAD
jgi:hypothetical protein